MPKTRTTLTNPYTNYLKGVKKQQVSGLQVPLKNTYKSSNLNSNPTSTTDLNKPILSNDDLRTAKQSINEESDCQSQFMKEHMGLQISQETKLQQITRDIQL